MLYIFCSNFTQSNKSTEIWRSIDWSRFGLVYLNLDRRLVSCTWRGWLVWLVTVWGFCLVGWLLPLSNGTAWRCPLWSTLKWFGRIIAYWLSISLSLVPRTNPDTSHGRSGYAGFEYGQAAADLVLAFEWKEEGDLRPACQDPAWEEGLQHQIRQWMSRWKKTPMSAHVTCQHQRDNVNRLTCQLPVGCQAGLVQGLWTVVQQQLQRGRAPPRMCWKSWFGDPLRGGRVRLHPVHNIMLVIRYFQATLRNF